MKISFSDFQKYQKVRKSKLTKLPLVSFPQSDKGYPAALALLWPLKLTASGVLKSAVGPAPVFTDVPTVDADGVTPGDGPSFSSVVTWADGGTRVWEITMSTASADIVGDVEVGGGLSVNSAGLKFSDGTNTSTWATSWAANELVTAIVSVMDDGVRSLMRVRREAV